MTPRLRTALAAAALALPALALPAGAATTATGTLSVTAVILDTCLVTATPLAFGNLSGATVTTEVAPATVTVTCTAAQPSVTVTLGGGASASGGVRQMTDGGAGRVPYTVYTNSARSSAVAVDGTIYTGAVAAATPSAISLWGKVPAGAYAAGAYADSATITVTY